MGFAKFAIIVTDKLSNIRYLATSLDEAQRH